MLPPVPSLPPRSLWGCFTYCLKRENYARFSGRSTRREYWSFFLFFILIGLLLGFLTTFGAAICMVIAGAVAHVIWFIGGLLLLLGFMLYTALPGLAVYVRRLHDVGWSGWWIGLHYGVGAVIFAIVWFQLMMGVQEWMWTNESVTWDAESLQSLGAYLETVPGFPLLDEISDVLTLVSHALGLFLFVLTLWPSQQKENRYGQKPLA
ncbi:MAG: DUF805 domain-containing protein [Akkermansia sp.]|nr:DUF805 domain-containing protein [Akkermansia sp.]